MEEEVTPFPTPLITPPTTKMYLGAFDFEDAFCLDAMVREV